jgi:hypothetical protein
MFNKYPRTARSRSAAHLQMLAGFAAEAVCHRGPWQTFQRQTEDPLGS